MQPKKQLKVQYIIIFEFMQDRRGSPVSLIFRPFCECVNSMFNVILV